MFAVLLLALCIGTQGFVLVTQKCYGKYGCFQNHAPFNNAKGFLPESPEDQGIQFLLFTRHNPTHAQTLHEDHAHSVHSSHYNKHHPTKMIIHGFTDSGHSQWIKDMTRELLHHGDMNVIVVNWEKGADSINYLHVAANTRIVGAVTAEMIKTLHGVGASYSNFHLIGHSLGSHISGYAGEIIHGLGRISGLDPAGPMFENFDPVVRLDRSDAKFVDIIHSDAETLVHLGLGMIKSIGDADFFPNGGKDQPGCPKHVGNHLYNLVTGFFPKVTDGASCSHNRAHEFFTASINNHCQFTSHHCADQSTYDAGRCNTCSHNGCTRMGYHASPSHHGNFYLKTTSTHGPYYCYFNLPRNSHNPVMLWFPLFILLLAVSSQGFVFNWWWEKCYGKYGCFNADSPFDNAKGYVPESPESMDIEFLLFTRSNIKQHLILEEDNQATVENSNYNAGKPTKLIIHGYTDSGRAAWIGQMAEDLLKAGDVNVIAVNWQRGADKTNYFQAAANTRVVGAVTAEMIKTLNAAGASFSNFHLIGHSLGAHTAGYVGEIIDGLGRITGLDPAGPAFEYYKRPARLDANDATFVDVIHSDAESLTALGFGMMKACGDADFYPNGGLDQPGCPANTGDHLFSLFTGGFESLRDGAACSHGRAIELFSSSINMHCEYKSYPCTEREFHAGQCTNCSDGCSNMGYHASPSKHGSFYLTTSAEKPYYCCE